MKPKASLTFLPAASGMVLLVLSLSLVVLKASGRPGEGVAENLRAKAATSDVVLALSPQSQTVEFTPNTSYVEGITLDSGGKKVKAVDVIISYNPEQISIEPQVAVGTLLEHYPLSRVDQKLGKIKISAINFTAKPALGIFATFRFKAKTIGQSQIAFDFIPGEKLDSNVVDFESDQDVLTKVQNASLTFK